MLERHNGAGQVIGTIVAIFAVALFAIPTGIIASGFEAKVVERHLARREARRKAARLKWQWAASQVVRQTRMQVILAFQTNVIRPVPVYTHPRVEASNDNGTAQGATYRFVFGISRTGQWFEHFITTLIVVNVASFFASTDSSVIDQGLADEGHGALWVVEAVSVAIFTVEYSLRLWSVGQDPAFAGWCGRLRYLTTFYAIVDLAAILPFFVDLALPQHFEGTTFIRALRLIRLLKGRKEVLKFEAVVTANTDVLEVWPHRALHLVVHFCDHT
jgi:hypothetical protein